MSVHEEAVIARSLIPVLAPPNAVAAPLPAHGDERTLPFEPDPGPESASCRRCGRVDDRLEAELLVAHQALDSLEELLVWMRDEVELANGARELVESEALAFGALVGEYDAVASSHEQTLTRMRRTLARSRRAHDQACARASAEEARASRLAAELKRAKDARTVAREGASQPVAKAHEARTPAPGTDDVLALALAACGAQDGDSRILDLEAELRHERALTARFERYVAALEARMQRLADAEMVDTVEAGVAPF